MNINHKIRPGTPYSTVATKQRRALLTCCALTLSLLLSVPTLASTLQVSKNFSKLAQNMKTTGKPLVLAFDAEYCTYCERLQADHLEPMSVSSDYEHVFIRTLEFDGDHEIIDFDGELIEASAFSARYKVRITPTLLFLNAEGEEVSDRMLGYNTPEFYGAYLDKAINKAVKAMNRGPLSTEETAKATK